MADNNVVGSLFGVTPEMYQQNRQAQQEAQALRMSQLAPEQLVTYLGARGGQNLGNVASSLLGVEDPQLQAVRKVSEMAKQFDTTTPGGLMQYAQALQQAGLPQYASMAADRANAMNKGALEQNKTLSEIQKNLREKMSPTAIMQEERRKLLESGVPETDQRIKELNASIVGEGKGKGTNIDLGGLSQLFAKSEASASGKEAADAINQASSALKTGAQVGRNITEIERLLPDTFTGQYSNFAKTSSKTLSALGIPVSDKASNTEVMQAMMNSLVMPMIKQLPGSLAAKELAFLQQQKPDSLQEPATIKRLLGMIKEDIAANRVLVKRADVHQKADKFGSLQGFNMGLQQDQIYQDLARYNRLKTAKTITQEDADFAKAFEKESGLK